VIGAALVAGGFATHAAFEVWAAPFAGRIEMGQFACFEFVLYAAGLGLAAVSLAGARGDRQAAGCVIWLVAALLAGFAVLWRLPP
jgi:hypothetical protein